MSTILIALAAGVVGAGILWLFQQWAQRKHDEESIARLTERAAQWCHDFHGKHERWPTVEELRTYCETTRRWEGVGIDDIPSVRQWIEQENVPQDVRDGLATGVTAFVRLDGTVWRYVPGTNGALIEQYDVNEGVARANPFKPVNIEPMTHKSLADRQMYESAVESYHRNAHDAAVNLVTTQFEVSDVPFTDAEMADALVESWHTADPSTGVPLHEHMGLTRDEYAHWIETSPGELPGDYLDRFHCSGGSDGECNWTACPQEAHERENYRIYCPLAKRDEEQGGPDYFGS